MFGWMLRRLLRPWGGEHGLPESIGPIFRGGGDAIFHANRSPPIFIADEPGRHFEPLRDALRFDADDDGAIFQASEDGVRIEADPEPPIFQPPRGPVKFIGADTSTAFQPESQTPRFEGQQPTDFPYPDPR